MKHSFKKPHVTFKNGIKYFDILFYKNVALTHIHFQMYYSKKTTRFFFEKN